MFQQMHINQNFKSIAHHKVILSNLSGCVCGRPKSCHMCLHSVYTVVRTWTESKQFPIASITWACLFRHRAVASGWLSPSNDSNYKPKHTVISMIHWHTFSQDSFSKNSRSKAVLGSLQYSGNSASSNRSMKGVILPTVWMNYHTNISSYVQHLLQHICRLHWYGNSVRCMIKNLIPRVQILVTAIVDIKITRII